VPDVPGRFDDPDLLLSHQLRYLLVHQIPSHYHIVMSSPSHVNHIFPSTFKQIAHIYLRIHYRLELRPPLLLDLSLRGTFYDRL
jgi:hypothetical protein